MSEEGPTHGVHLTITHLLTTSKPSTSSPSPRKQQNNTKRSCLTTSHTRRIHTYLTFVCVCVCVFFFFCSSAQRSYPPTSTRTYIYSPVLISHPRQMQHTLCSHPTRQRPYLANAARTEVRQRNASVLDTGTTAAQVSHPRIPVLVPRADRCFVQYLVRVAKLLALPGDKIGDRRLATLHRPTHYDLEALFTHTLW